MLARRLFSVTFMAHKTFLPAFPSLQTPYRAVSASWDGSKSGIALNVLEAGRTGQSHERWLYP